MSRMLLSITVTCMLAVFNPAGAAVDDSIVKEWIIASLGGHPGGNDDAVIAGNYLPGDIRVGWGRLKQCRDGGDTQDRNLAAAEHYMFARWVASKNGDTLYRNLPEWYETIKKYAIKADLDRHLRSSDKPVSPVDERVTAWGKMGVEHGLTDYSRREGKPPVAGSAAIVTLVGSAYVIYYHHAPSSGACDVAIGTDGTWVSTDEAQRWQLEISKGRCVWIERAASGETLRREVVLAKDASGSFKISRPNDAEVLTFLGFAPAIRTEVLARSPRPSFMVLKRSGTDLTGQWSGLLVIKDEKARFKELRQPGDMPAKEYRFKRVPLV